MHLTTVVPVGLRKLGMRSLPTEKEENVLAELLLILAKGSSHCFIINGDPSIHISLCKMLGFFLVMDYCAYLVSRNLSVYKLNKKSGRWR